METFGTAGGVDGSFVSKDIWTSLTLHDHHWIGRHEIFVKKNRWLLPKATFVYFGGKAAVII